MAFVWLEHPQFFRGLGLQPADYSAQAAQAVRHRLIELAAGPPSDAPPATAATSIE